MPAAGAAKDQGNGARISAIMALAMKAKAAAFLPLREIAPLSRHSTIEGPSVLFSKSQRSRRGLLLLKKNAARMKNGVAGRSGNITPNAPSPMLASPAIM